jgi:hypothetical protein
MSKCCVANRYANLLLQNYQNYMERDLDLKIKSNDGKDTFQVSGRFDKGIDLLHLTQELRCAAEADGVKKGSTIVQLSYEASYLLHTFNETESLYIRESDGYFVLFGFTDVGKIINTIVEIQYFIEMQ